MNDIIHVLGDLQDAEEQAEFRRMFRKREDPFDLPDARFIKYFRVNKDLARYIIELVTPYIEAPSRSSALSVETKVLIALKFFGFGSYQEITGSNIFTSVSQSSVSRSIKDVCHALTHPDIFQQWVRFPRNIGEMESLRQRFFRKYEFPGIIGCVDCTHVAIVAPTDRDPDYPEHIYVNRKNYHSINVQLIYDENLYILNVNARFPGSTHDAHIWRQSAVSETMENIYRNNNENFFFLLGDSGYPLRPWLLTPLREPPPNSPEERFNNKLKIICSIIERCNGLLKNRFRCLLRHRVLHYCPQNASKIINSCVVLHMCIRHRIPEPAYNDEMIDADFGMQIDPPAEEVNAERINPDLLAARQLQQRLINNYFN